MLVRERLVRGRLGERGAVPEFDRAVARSDGESAAVRAEGDPVEGRFVGDKPPVSIRVPSPPMYVTALRTPSGTKIRCTGFLSPDGPPAQLMGNEDRNGLRLVQNGPPIPPRPLPREFLRKIPT